MTEKEYAESIFDSLEVIEKKMMDEDHTATELQFVVQVEILRQLRIQTGLISQLLSVRPVSSISALPIKD